MRCIFCLLTIECASSGCASIDSSLRTPSTPGRAGESRGWRISPTARLAADLGAPVPALLGATQTPAAVTARQLLAYVWVEVLGRRASSLAQEIGQTRGNVSRAAQRGATPATRWQARIPTWCR